MAIVPNGVETSPKISIACTNITDRQDDRRTTTYSEREREFTFAKNWLFKFSHFVIPAEKFNINT